MHIIISVGLPDRGDLSAINTSTDTDLRIYSLLTIPWTHLLLKSALYD